MATLAATGIFVAVIALIPDWADFIGSDDKPPSPPATGATVAATTQPTSQPDSASRDRAAGGSSANPIDPLNCFGSPRDVTLTPASGPAGSQVRVRSKGYLTGEKVRVSTWAGSEWEAIADRSGAINVRARIPTMVPGESVPVQVRGVKSGCSGDAIFALE
ncbi:hypothetical protein Axi01nite_66690 [Actinoplanes xinjiangensis]|nr:hypothetical protein Axi01nite_66690 [Actinoplanes xinjiangensis]